MLLFLLLLVVTTLHPFVDGWSQNLHPSRIKPKPWIDSSSSSSSLPSTSESDLQIEAPEEDSAPSSNYFGLNDTDFEAWIKSELFLDPLSQQYPILFEGAAMAITQWRKRYRGNPKLWRRLFKKDRVLKEFVEAAPILNAVIQLIQESTHTTNFTIIDLASGKGYLSMFLSELLPPEKVQGLVLMDKAWPRRDQPLQKDHHISWEHIYGNDENTTTTNSTTTTYYDTWPIPLVTSKQDLKQKCTLRSLQKRFFDPAPGPILLLAVHFCGTLSLRAIDMFHDNPNSIAFLALKPCCLPPMVHAQREELFRIGNHSFAAELVCSNGKFNTNRWYGPPRWHLKQRFQTWADHLFEGVQVGVEGTKARVNVTVQREGGYQNSFIFAQREPVVSAVWETLERDMVSSFRGN